MWANRLVVERFSWIVRAEEGDTFTLRDVASVHADMSARADAVDEDDPAFIFFELHFTVHPHESRLWRLEHSRANPECGRTALWRKPFQGISRRHGPRGSPPANHFAAVDRERCASYAVVAQIVRDLVRCARDFFAEFLTKSFVREEVTRSLPEREVPGEGSSLSPETRRLQMVDGVLGNDHLDRSPIQGLEKLNER